uniref:Cystatin domain-containing protein n=1 Tax=Pygocentrus nattereri TaxID=42514 RepID=A0AAR2J9R1_PYGNA
QDPRGLMGVCPTTEVEEKTGKTFTVFEALMYRKQTVEGTNYEIKVDDHISAAEVLLAEQ